MSPSEQEQERTPGERHAAFNSTRWSIVLQAGGSTPRAMAALEKLCATYWPPLYEFVRRQGHDAGTAQDLTQGFFAQLLERDDLKDLDPDRGRFRSFLLAALKHYLCNQWDRQRAQKRGGGRPVLSFDFASAESTIRMEPADQNTPETVFHRKWALALLGQVQTRLEEEMEAEGRRELYLALQPHLVGDLEAKKYREVAACLGMTEAAVKMAMSRLRKRYRHLLRAEIAETVSSEAEIDDEIRDLFRVLRE